MAAHGDSAAMVATIFDACAYACADPSVAAARRDALIAVYGGADRHYHDIHHIAAMLALLDNHAPAHTDTAALRWAILYHDAVYDPRAMDNEAASAAMAVRDLAAMGIGREVCERVAALILATRHAPPDVLAPDMQTDEARALLVDIDLAVLAAPPDAYDTYAKAIRREYAHVPEPLYRDGRTRVLQGFLDRARIFLTPALAARWEGAARCNLMREIEVLRNSR